MHRKPLLLLAIFAIGFIAMQCAKEVSPSNEEIQRKILLANLQEYYPNAQFTESGLIILEEEPGTGKQMENLNAAYCKCTVSSLNGEIISYQDEETARERGEYSKENYYGPTLRLAGAGTEQLGFTEAMLRMKEGGRIKVIIPPELSYYDYYDDGVEQKMNSALNLIYEINMYEVIDDLAEYQEDSLRSYSNLRYGGIDTLETAIYVKKLSGFRTDTIDDGKSVNVWYVGKLLDGYVFDTNIADTAKKYGIYSSSSTYEALEVTVESSWVDMATFSYSSSNVSGYESSASTSGDSSSSSLIPGFARAIKCMTYGDHAVAFFGSQWGYGGTGSMQDMSGVPPYSMLFFDIYIDEEEE